MKRLLKFGVGPKTLFKCLLTSELLLILRLVETHIFSFVVGRAFVTDVEKLKIINKSRSLDVGSVLRFFSEVTKVCLLVAFIWILSSSSTSLLFLAFFWFSFKDLFMARFFCTLVQDGIKPGSNLLNAVEVLVSGVYP